MFVSFLLPRRSFWGVSGGLSVLSNFFFGGRLLGFVVMGGMPGVSYCLVYFFGGLQFHCYVGVGSSLDLVQHGACSSSWSSFPLIIQWTSSLLGRIYFWCVLLLVFFFLFSIIHILLNLLNDFVCSLHILGAVGNLCGFQFLHSSYILEVWYTFLCDTQTFGSYGISKDLGYRFLLLLLKSQFLFL